MDLLKKFPYVTGGVIGAFVMGGVVAVFVAMYAAGAYRIAQQTRMYQEAARAQAIIYRTCITINDVEWCTDSEKPKPLTTADIKAE